MTIQEYVKSNDFKDRAAEMKAWFDEIYDTSPIIKKLDMIQKNYDHGKRLIQDGIMLCDDAMIQLTKLRQSVEVDEENECLEINI